MKVTLKNNKYEVVLNTHGAEINSFRSVEKGTQFVFEGPESVWKFHAPVLFPHVGRIKDGFYTYNGNEYNLVNNGMSRDMEHTIIAQDEKSVTFELTENELKEVLIGLGYKDKELKPVLAKVDTSLSIEEQVKEALKLLGK